MILLTHPKIKELLAKKYGYDETTLKQMQIAHTSKLLTMMFSLVVTYIEDKNLENELKEIERLTAENDPKLNNQAEQLEKLVDLLIKTFEEYPDMQKIYQEQVKELNTALMQTLMDGADDETVATVYNVAAEDLKRLNSKLLPNK